MNSGHEVLVKITEYGDEEGSRTEERIGDVLLVRTGEPADSVRGPLTPDEATTVVRVVTRNPGLDGDRFEMLSKASLIGRTWIETIEVGVAVPA